MVGKVWESLMNDEIRTLGFYGMGGVGKTTLLACINNKFVELESEFDVVIWVVVSKEFQFEGIQDQMLGRLRLDKEWERETENNVIREMALWINSDFGKQQETICVKSGTHVRLIPNDINWENVRQMSLISTQIEKISCSPNCPNLSTLLLPYNKLVNISVGFFRVMPKLVVLDLSTNMSLIELPEEISNLCSMQYLNLSSTRIKSLPVGLKKLRKLIYLNLEFSYKLESLLGIAETLPNLQVLKLFYSHVFVDDILMEELEHLEHMKILTVTIEGAMILEGYKEWTDWRVVFEVYV